MYTDGSGNEDQSQATLEELLRGRTERIIMGFCELTDTGFCFVCFFLSFFLFFLSFFPFNIFSLEINSNI